MDPNEQDLTSITDESIAGVTHTNVVAENEKDVVPAPNESSVVVK